MSSVSILLLCIIALYVSTVVERHLKSKGKCTFRHEWVYYSPRYTRQDLYKTLTKLNLFCKDELKSYNDSLKWMKGSMLTLHTCKRCKAKKSHRESL